MSAGHRDHTAPAGVSARAIDNYLADGELQRLVHRVKEVNRDYDLPYLAGYSTDGETIYLDRHLPEKLYGYMDGRKYVFDPTPFLRTHESWEKAFIDHYGYSYGPAHQRATKIEHRAVVAAGIPIDIYDGRGSEMAKYIKADEHEKITKVPKDLDLTPYYGDKRLLSHIMECMGRGNGKESKEKANYTSKGTPSEHCARVKEWPKGSCVHYIDPNECEKVKGAINPKGWCKHWAPE